VNAKERRVRGGIVRITALAILLTAVGAGSSSAAGWSIQSMPKPPRAVSAFPVAVSCSNHQTCTSVGYYYDGDIVSRLLAERWTAGRWRVLAIPAPADATSAELRAVSCTTPRACTAVGDYTSASGSTTPLAERWNGKVWSIEPIASGDAGFGELVGVSCTSNRSCTAVGQRLDLAQFPPTSATLAEHWNGHTWRVQPTPVVDGGASQLSAVSCPSASSCAAVGSRFSSSGEEATLALRWNNSSWSIDPTPNPSGNPPAGYELLSVSCASATFCKAVGQAQTTVLPASVSRVTESWNGSAWSLEHTPTGDVAYNALQGVSCASASECIPVGFRGFSDTATLANRWNGSAWSLESTPNPADGSLLSAVSCPAAGVCTTVGYYSAGTSAETPFAERYSGG
jgi:hypothetical protein